MIRTPSAIAILLLLAACGEKQQPAAQPGVTDAIVRLAAVEGRPAAAYFTLHGGPKTDRLTSVSSPKVATIELHESSMANGMMRMTPLTGVDLLPRSNVAFKPGGNHAMLFGVDPSVKAGGSLQLHFVFQSGTAFNVEAKAIAAGDAMQEH